MHILCRSYHSDRQQQKQARLFTATDNGAVHTPHDATYTSGGGYFDGHGVPTSDRTRGQANRQQQLGRGLMEYSDSSYHGQHGQDSSSLASQHQQQAGGMAGASMDGLPLMSPSHPSLPFSLLSSGNAVAKSLSASLDSVPMGLGPSGMMSHPNYGSVPSYMSAPPTPMGSKGGAINTAVVPGTVTRPTPPPGPQRSQSAHTTATGGQGSTNISFTEPPPPPGMHQHHQHQQHHHHNNHNSHNHHYSSSLPNLSMPSVLSGAEFSDESSHNNSGGGGGLHGLSIATGSNPTAGGGSSSTSSSPTSGKPRPGGHPRSAVAARVFECSFPGCNKAYTQLHNLKSHERTGHTPVQKPRPFLCIIPGCTKAFSQRKSLALHIRASHKEYKFKPFKCSQQGCDKSYTQLHNLRTHEKTVHMLDLSRKRIRNPVPYSEDGGGSGSGGMKMEGSGGGASSMMMAGLPGSSSFDRGGHFSGDVGLSYESINDLNDFSTAGRMPSDGEEYDRRRGPMGVGGSIGEDDEEDEEGLADLKEEGDDEEDGDYVDE
ncbi:hypothetical protein BGZ96_009834 [Linnemannia gamsii]|uniref:C2H2-type domain-containing protein n=1 Tax=Linnemannia gamsii TaxID=64522 RepID=A0ABQ7KEV2_9FUNG|nr:hypothetical protein BGZ96_009834 [Linnemannia gamsii]